MYGSGSRYTGGDLYVGALVLIANMVAVTATGTSAAGVPTLVIGTKISMSGATASVAVSTTAPTVNIKLGFSAFYGATATVMANSSGAAKAFIGPFALGDLFNKAIELDGLSGALAVDLLNSTVQDGEPNPGDSTHSVWLVLRPATPGSLVLRGVEASFDYYLEYFQGSTLADLDLVSIAEYRQGISPALPEITQDVGALGPHYFRIRSRGATGDASVALTWDFGQRLPVLVLDVRQSEVRQTPGVTRLSVLNADPREDVTFSVVGRPGTNYVTKADSAGVIQSVTFPLPALPAGTHLIRAQGATSGRSDVELLYVLTGPPSRPTTQVVDAPASDVVQVGVRKWVLQDPAPGGVEYVVPINPEKMSSPHAPRMAEVETTTAADGMPIIWEGARRAHEWTFEGTLLTQAYYDMLAYFTGLQRRFYLIDHLNRAWVVSFEDFSPVPKRAVGSPWAHRYTVKALVYQGPTTPEG